MKTFPEHSWKRFYKAIFLARPFPVHITSAQKPLHANVLWVVEQVAPEVFLAGRKEGRKVVLSLSFYWMLHLSPVVVACHRREQSGVPTGREGLQSTDTAPFFRPALKWAPWG